MVQTIKTGNKNILGFTIVELLVVLLIVALLASLVTPLVTKSIQRAKESTLKENLMLMRKSIDDYYADTNKYPKSLEILVTKRYIRKVPIDPITDSKTTWKLVGKNEVSDVKSGSNEKAMDGTKYNEW